MNQSRSHLMPTPIVDRNGVLTSRLMKNGLAAPAQRSGIPTVSIKPDALHQTENTVDAVMDLVADKGGVQHDRRFFECLDEDDPETLPLAIKLMTSGSDISQHRTMGLLLYLVNSMRHASEMHRNWQNHCDTSWSPFNKHTLLTSWNACEIIGETGSTYTPLQIETEVSRLDENINVYSSHGDRSHNNDYWRGLAILASGNIDYFALSRDDREHAGEFAVWAARQPDASAIIRIIEERRTIRIDTVSDLLAQQSSNLPLGKGVL